MKAEALTHTFEPVYDKNSKILILGSFPSVKSREAMFYYGHPQNRFWRIISELTGGAPDYEIQQKKAMLLQNKIAVWDVIHSCTIIGSSDSSIKNVIPNDIKSLLDNSEIKTIYANGKTAESLYNKYVYPVTKLEITALPSTSPANAAYDFERLKSSWKVILKEL